MLTIAHALFEGNPQPVLANTGKLNDIAAELRQLMNEQQGDAVAETPIHGYGLAKYGNCPTVGTAFTFDLPGFAQIKSRWGE
ncbi:Putative inner membrane protein [Salmonella enterica subsp. enterica]|uniref:Inner membrane protein n=1 Tax=Salmonella enterica I TaxID=59201 RepID=A0A447U0R5_SALET|nr:Putative inner membrane protein [Salmonella enterica subsp. enterica]